MRPNVIIGDCHLYLGDCREILPHLPKVDLILTDPPYSEKTHSNAKSNAGGRRGAKAIDFKAIDFKAIDFKAIEELLDACSVICDGWIVANMEWRHIARLEFEPHHYFELVRFGVWVKTNPMPQISADRPANGWDGIAYLYPKGKKKFWNGGGAHGNWIGPVVANGDHPTGKPIQMLETWVSRFARDKAVIADPFMGSGTTGVACANMGKTFYGIERDPKYFDIACKRIEAAYAQGRLFA
jgi:site-specific DNA-methyltransferase (adenine-specific)